MKRAEKVKGVEGARPPEGGRGVLKAHRRYYPYEVRRKAVRLYLEEGIPSGLVAKELGVCHSAIFKWVERYRQEGEAGLRTAYDPERRRRANGALTAMQTQIVAVKRSNPGFGVKRIAQWLKRALFLPTSAATVSRTLHAQQMMPAAKPKTKRNPSKPRFFERSTPNQMWQSDIFPFRLTGQYAYLIGFIDDHSRFITGLGLYRTQTAENVLEVYRRATGAYGVPKEMLTDNGRQYTNWRGKTRFEHELQKDRVHHIRSSPHHPQTLGKIERFWKSIWEEFLSRAQFETFESARERIAWWVQYYNQQRPHQGVDGLCPADRFFALQKEVGAAMKKGAAANLRELALRGKPKESFYMVGRVGEQSVVIQADEGKVRLTVGEADKKAANGEGEGHEHEHGEKDEASAAELSGEREGGGGAGGVGRTAPGGACVPGAGHQLGNPQRVGEAGDPGDSSEPGLIGGGACRAGGPDVGQTAGGLVGPDGGARGGADGSGKSGGNGTQGVTYPRNVGECCHEDAGGTGRGVMSGGVGGVGGEAVDQAGLRGAGDQRKGVPALAGAGDGGPAQGARASGGPGGGTGPGAEPPAQAAIGAQGGGTGGAVAPVDETTGGPERPAGNNGGPGLMAGIAGEVRHEEGSSGVGRVGAAPGGTDHPGAGGADDGGGRGGPPGCVPQNLLQVGTTGPLGHPGVAAGRETGAPGADRGSGEGEAAAGPGAVAGRGSGAGSTPARAGGDAGTRAG